MVGFFVTGCDTGVGKTHVACALASLGVARGLRVRVYKPVETGCDPDPADATLLARAAHDDRPLSEICPVQLRTPISPHAAAHLEGRTIDPPALVRGLPADADLLIVEGAGGLLSPLDDHLVMADLAARLSLPLLVVINHALGAINRSMLTVEAARHRHLPIAALVLNPTTATPAPDDADAIARFTRTAVLGPLPYGDRLGGSSMLESLLDSPPSPRAAYRAAGRGSG